MSESFSPNEVDIIVKAFTEMCEACFCVNLEDNTYSSIFIKPSISKHFKEKGSYSNNFIPDVQKFSLKKDYKKISDFFENKAMPFLDLINVEHNYCRVTKIITDKTMIITMQNANCNEKISVLNTLAYYDVITGGYNFNFFKERLNEFEKIDGCIVAMNIRGFQVINSIIGIENGNVMLKEISHIIDSHLFEHEYSAHIAGDQFVIFLTEIERNTITKRLLEIAGEIKNIKINDSKIDIESFFGVISWNGYSNIEITYSNAKSVLNIRRTENRSIVSYFDYSLEELIQDQKEFEHNFQRAIANEDFEIMFQPKYDSKTEKIIEAEALVRWNYNDKIIMPNEFIPLFEYNGMISILDEYVFRKVCQEIVYQRENHIEVVPISVNLSRKSLYKKDIVERLSDIADYYNVSKLLIPIEITETAELERKRFQEVDKELKQAGFVLQMDDFGTGYCSLESLLEMDFDTIKLDKTIIDHSDLDTGKTLIEYSVALAKNMGMKVTAEGVETREQLKLLRNLGCDNIQGYYFSKPLVKEAYYDLIKKQ